MKLYKVCYIEYTGGKDKEVCVEAKNSYEAYCEVVNDYNPYAAYVESYTTRSGKEHRFIKNIYGNAY